MYREKRRRKEKRKKKGIVVKISVKLPLPCLSVAPQRRKPLGSGLLYSRRIHQDRNKRRTRATPDTRYHEPRLPAALPVPPSPYWLLRQIGRHYFIVMFRVLLSRVLLCFCELWGGTVCKHRKNGGRHCGVCLLLPCTSSFLPRMVLSHPVVGHTGRSAFRRPSPTRSTAMPM